MSEHRRRSPDKPAHRRVGVFMITSMTSILVVTSAGYVALRAHGGASGADPVAIAAAEIRGSHAAVVLEQERQHMILMDAASRTLNVASSPKLAVQPATPAPAKAAGAVADENNAPPPPPAPDPGTAQSIALSLLPSFGFASSEYSCLNDIWTRESGWRYNAENATSGAYGIPQALPGSKMASVAADWETDPTTQIKWGLGYIKERYGTPCGAWTWWEDHGWY